MADKVDIFVRAGMRVHAGRSVSRCAAGWIFFILIYFKIPRIINAGKNSVGRIFADKCVHINLHSASSGKQTELLIPCLPYFAWNLGTVSNQIAADIVFVQFGGIHHVTGTGDEVQGTF